MVPLRWVRVFWIAFVSKGAHAIGLREKQWIACETGVPYFPSDFPDCNAYSSFMATEAAATDQKSELRPTAMRPLRVPIPSPWNINCGKNNRVHLHAYKEGVFEEGAVVCAPSLSDVSQWTSRSEIKEIGIEMPQSSVRSYFKETASWKWELQIAEDPASKVSHRWPISFVTTGFVRGSKKPVAEAFCEAVLLARLREEQWNEMAVKRRRKEIYVLVRNLRSSPLLVLPTGRT
ncbi:hypothetical protein LWI29_025414 [Acer saccharum]|uniref:POPLD domain-containing protein n=1 Tax=Acer saccharum TaxID=4024 RepID=A0AA39SAC8_ACESA|nr:hypothetical protein LWI29_025414 [Acer saccharum]